MPLDRQLTQNKQRDQIEQLPNEQPTCQPISLNEIAEAEQDKRRRVAELSSNCFDFRCCKYRRITNPPNTNQLAPSNKLKPCCQTRSLSEPLGSYSHHVCHHSRSSQSTYSPDLPITIKRSGTFDPPLAASVTLNIVCSFAVL